MINGPRISVIVPVYNVKKYIRECINTILSQSYKNYEIVLVDDGSTDGSGAVCDEYQNKHPKTVKVVHKHNEGLNYARRDGFQAASGEYITFIDSDDLVHEDYLKTLLNSLQKNKVDVSIGGFQEFSDHHDVKLIDEIDETVEKDTARIMNWFIKGETPWKNRVFMMTAWGKLFHRDLLATIDWDFSNYRSNEDEFWTMQVLYGAKGGIVVVPSELYYYRSNQDSITRKKYKNNFNGRNLNKFEFIEELYQKSLTYLGKDYERDLLWRFVVQIIVFIDRYAGSKMLTYSDIMSAKTFLDPKISTITELSLPESIEQKVHFIKKRGIWLYVLSVKCPRVWRAGQKMRRLQF